MFGVIFRPVGFGPFLNVPAYEIADRLVPASSILGNVDALQTVVLSDCEEDEKVEAANAFFHACVPKHDETITLAGQLVNRICEDRDIKTVDGLVAAFGIGKRSLQRIFNEYVGVSPKWVIRRYRLHELIERSNSGDVADWSQLALELGYFDQAHLINDFHSITGYSPTEYQALLRGKVTLQP